LKEIPAGLFDNCVYASDFQYCFKECSSLREMPYDLFYKCLNASDFKFCFSGCKLLKVGYIPICYGYKSNLIWYACTFTDIRILVANSVTPASIYNKDDELPNSIEKIYVPDSAIDTYKTATNWSAFADKIVGFSELTDEEKKKYGITA